MRHAEKLDALQQIFQTLATYREMPPAPGDKDDGYRRMGLSDRKDGGDTIRIGHEEIAYHKIEMGRHFLDRSITVVEFGHLESIQGQRSTDCLPHGIVVINHQHFLQF